MSRALKILYAVQGTGNGHVARAREIIPILQKYGAVDVVLSGDQSEVNLPVQPKYRSKGVTFIYNKKGGISYPKTLLKNNIIRVLLEIFQFPIKEYDVVINDFESITAWACKLRGKECFGLGHQASFQSDKCPKPKHKDIIGSIILKWYAPCSEYLGFHFDRYDRFIYPPVIRQEVRNLIPENKGHYTVYLPAFGIDEIHPVLGSVNEAQWQVFTKHVSEITTRGNVTFFPVSSEGFVNSFTKCAGVFTSAGFETPAEALFLGKKLMVVPIQGQYEQFCNAAGLAKMGIPVMDKFNLKSVEAIRSWVQHNEAITVQYPDQTEFLIYSHILSPFIKGKEQLQLVDN